MIGPIPAAIPPVIKLANMAIYAMAVNADTPFSPAIFIKAKLNIKEVVAAAKEPTPSDEPLYNKSRE